MSLFKSKPDPMSLPTLGGAHLATHAEITAAGLTGEEGLLLGEKFDYWESDEPKVRKKKIDHLNAHPDADVSKLRYRIRYNGDGHLILVAPTRSGKGTDMLVPNLLEYPGSCIVIDPKGQLAAITRAERRRLGQDIIILNPLGKNLPVDLGPSAKYNPMAILNPKLDTFGADCDSLAEAIVMHAERDSHWTDSARQLVSGIIMYLAEFGRDDQKNLSAVRRVISGPTSALKAFVGAAMGADVDGFISERLARFEDVNEDSKELLGIISTANTQSGFIANKSIAASLSGSDFRFRELKRKPTTVYVILPANYIETCGKWFRLIVASALADLWSEAKGPVRVLAILDEFAQLGRLKVIEHAMGMAAGFGLQLWPILQDLTQLKDLYGEKWETFLANTAIQQFFAPRDNTTAKYVSERTGVRTAVSFARSSSSGSGTYSSGESSSQTQQPLLHPHEVAGLAPTQSLIFGPRNLVIKASRFSYVAWNTTLVNDDPYHNPNAAAEVLESVRKDGGAVAMVNAAEAESSCTEGLDTPPLYDGQILIMENTGETIRLDDLDHACLQQAHSLSPLYRRDYRGGLPSLEEAKKQLRLSRIKLVGPPFPERPTR